MDPHSFGHQPKHTHTHARAHQPTNKISVYVVTRKAAGFGMGYVGGRFEVAKGTHLSCTYVLSQKNKVGQCVSCVLSGY